MIETTTRVPRPKGVTYLSIEYNKSKDNQAYLALIQHIITQYALSGFRYLGIPVSIPMLAQNLNIPQSQIVQAVSQVGNNLGNFDNGEAVQDTIKTIMALSTQFAMQDRGLIHNQLETLLISQDGKYKPFVTSEVNKNLKLMLDSTKNIMDLHKTFFTDASTTNIINVPGSDKDDQGTPFLTPDEALDLITNNQDNKSLPDPPSLPALSSPSDADKSLPADAEEELDLGVNSLNPQADELYRKHGIGELSDVKEGRTGTEALRALEPGIDGHEKLKDPKAKKPNSHDDAFKRRGIEIEDIDELPDS